ncbi:hypothetical protein CYMTET_9696 [Cymbomonas tetramitiformis]|uniref:GON domain-containing protein n=1 Tax=Cymbomonas tetramitiformis TaxID=36881 RepID=A0AAE0LEW1_9CHLO|nr:hypothetical protein CYMTET_9696 [Cymbomonas tetramitiformis]
MSQSPQSIEAAQLLLTAANASKRARDGEYDLYVNHDPRKPWRAYCVLSEQPPREYLVLHPDTRDTAQGGGNVSCALGLPDDLTLQVSTRWDRVRLSPQGLVAHTGDFTFAQVTANSATSGQSRTIAIPFGLAMDSVGAHSYSATSRIDLRGTPFSVHSEFCHGGTASAGGATFSEQRQVVDICGGGMPGWCYVAKHCNDPDGIMGILGGGWHLELAYSGDV